MLLPLGKAARNLRRALRIREEAPTAVEALALMFLDAGIEDDGTPAGRLRALLAVTEHRFVPGLHQGIRIGLTGFRKEYQDPWPTSTDQAGHFLTAVRLSFDPAFLAWPIFPILLGSWGDSDVPLRLTIGHEKKPDPPNLTEQNPATLFRAIRHFRRQYQAATAEDVAHFKSGRLEAIRLGGGLGNSMADLALSRKGWQFGQLMAAGHFRTTSEVANWIRTELADGPPE